MSRSRPGPASTDAVLRRAAAALLTRAGDLGPVVEALKDFDKRQRLGQE